MAIPKRKSEMIKNIIKNQEREKKKIILEQDTISQEEHEKRLKKFKDLGLIK